MNRTIEVIEDGVQPFVACDHCGHRSYYFIQLRTGGELSYCAHAYQKYHDKLWESAVKIVDMSHTI